MKPAGFEYHAPRDLDEVLALLVRYGPEAKLLAGGQSLVPLMNFRLARPAHVIDINRVGTLGGIAHDGALHLGALTRQQEIATSSLVAESAPLLADATRWIGHPAIRARGTLGGSVAHNDPAAEYPAALLALDAAVKLRGARGDRSIPIDDFLGDWLSTSLASDEILTEVTVPASPTGTRTAIAELARRHGDFALAGVAVRVVREGALVSDPRLVAFGGLPRARRLTSAEAVLDGASPTPEVLADVADRARSEVDPTGDIHATADYRRHLVGVLAVRALRTALGMEA